MLVFMFQDVMITCQRAVTALSVNPVAPYQLAIGCSDSTVRMFDRRMLGTKASGILLHNYVLSTTGYGKDLKGFEK